MKIDISKFKKILVPVVVVIVLLGVAGALYYFDQGNKNKLSSEKAGTKVIDFINKNLLNGQATATLQTITEESGVYKILFKVETQEYTFYLSKDGKLLFTAGGPMPETTQANGNDANTAAQTNIPKQDASQALLFVMSFCPYGNQADEAMLPVANLLKDKADIQVHYVIYSNYSTGYPNYCLDKENKYCSMHGIQELNQDVRELCVQKYQKDKFWDFLKAINVQCTAQNADVCWEAVASSLSINTAKVKTCQKDEALTLLAQEVQLNKTLSVTGSPQLIINGAEYSGARSAEGYKTGLCSGFNTAPAECSQTLQSSADTTNSAAACQ